MSVLENFDFKCYESLAILFVRVYLSWITSRKVGLLIIFAEYLENDSAELSISHHQIVNSCSASGALRREWEHDEKKCIKHDAERKECSDKVKTRITEDSIDDNCEICVIWHLGLNSIRIRVVRLLLHEEATQKELLVNSNHLVKSDPVIKFKWTY